MNTTGIPNHFNSDLLDGDADDAAFDEMTENLFGESEGRPAQIAQDVERIMQRISERRKHVVEFDILGGHILLRPPPFLIRLIERVKTGVAVAGTIGARWAALSKRGDESQISESFDSPARDAITRLAYNHARVKLELIHRIRLSGVLRSTSNLVDALMRQIVFEALALKASGWPGTFLGEPEFAFPLTGEGLLEYIGVDVADLEKWPSAQKATALDARLEYAAREAIERIDGIEQRP